MILEKIIAACRAAGFEPRIGQSVSQIASAINLVANGMGVTLVPDSMKFLHVPGVVYLPLARNALMARLAVACRRDNRSPLVRNFLAKCLSET